MMTSGAKALEQKKHEVDALNVFPVPDGDTGTNMFLTIQAAAKDAEKAAGEGIIGDVAAAASMGALMGARGNSGVILSQLLRGIARGFEGLAEAGPLQVAQALQSGVDTAYKAVMKPVEGTILTVSKETAKAAIVAAKRGDSLLETLQEAHRKGTQSLLKTPDLLPVLKQAGVVDAGGQGFLIIVGGWIAVLSGDVVLPEVSVVLDKPAPQVQEDSEEQKITRIESLDYPYCTEFLVKGSDLQVERIRQELKDRGDSLLAVGTTSVVKIHIHTKNPGKILEYALQWGSLHHVQIHNMLDQNENMAHAKKTDLPVEAEDTDLTAPEGAGTPREVREESGTEIHTLKEYGLVAVVMGEGIADVYRSLGVDEVVYGGQTMNPSTEELAEVVQKIQARHVYILPNNGNIIMAANQVKDIVQDRSVHVIPSKSIPQGIAALLNFNGEAEAEENKRNMESGLQDVVSGEVTYAVRDSQFGELEITAGDILGLADGAIVNSGQVLLEVAQETLEKMTWRDYDLVTIFYGEDTKAEEVEALENWLQEENPNIEVEVHPGGQPLYYYIFGVQ